VPLLDQPLQIGWQRHAVDVGDIGGAQLDPGVAKSPHRAFQPKRAARALVIAEQRGPEVLVVEVLAA